MSLSSLRNRHQLFDNSKNNCKNRADAAITPPDLSLRPTKWPSCFPPSAFWSCLLLGLRSRWVRRGRPFTGSTSTIGSRRRSGGGRIPCRGESGSGRRKGLLTTTLHWFDTTGRSDAVKDDILSETEADLLWLSPRGMLLLKSTSWDSKIFSSSSFPLLSDFEQILCWLL